MKTKKVKRYVAVLRDRQHMYERTFWNAPDKHPSLQHYWSVASTLKVVANEMERELLGIVPTDDTGCIPQEVHERGMR